MQLDGKKAVVAGASVGIGRSIALTFADAGADVVVASRRPDILEEVVKEIGAKGRKGMAVKADISQKNDVDRMIKKAVEEFGKVDILVNNAAYTALGWKDFYKTEVVEWDQQIDVTFKGTLYCCKAVIPHMIAQRSGKIINITSVAARMYTPQIALYSACKAAIISFSRAIAAELGPYGIHVNCVAPHAVLTPALEKIPDDFRGNKNSALRKEGEPEDIANMVLFLVSDKANYITGQQYCVDGGFILNP